MTKPDSERDRVREWVNNWKVVGKEMDRMKVAELRALSEEESARWFDGLGLPTGDIWRTPERLEAHGMVEQQRIFQKAHVQRP